MALNVKENGARLREDRGCYWIRCEREIVVIDTDRACGLTPDGDTFGITSEIGNIGTHPFERGALVEYAQILRI